ncbi:MAG: hypothetical protein AB7G36_18825 [Candidatus Nanopelagicales bacterium]
MRGAMLELGTIVIVLTALFAFITVVGLAVPEARDAMAGKLPEFAAAAFSGLLVALGQGVERLRSLGGSPADVSRPPASATPPDEEAPDGR